MSQDTPHVAEMAASLSALVLTANTDDLPAVSLEDGDVSLETITHEHDADAADLGAADAGAPTDETIANPNTHNLFENQMDVAQPEQPRGEAAHVNDSNHGHTVAGLADVYPLTEDDHAGDTTFHDRAAAHDDDGETSSGPTGETGQIVARKAAAGIDADFFKGFPAAPRLPGEFQLPLCDLVIGETSEGGAYDFDSGAANMLCHAVMVPEKIAPIIVMKTANVWHVIDGWARVTAFRFQFGNTANLLVRVVAWDGTRNEALYSRFAATFLTLNSRKIDKAVLLRQFHLAWTVPQQVLAARIGWTESRVTRELAAAQAILEAPRFADLHVKAGDPPIDYLYKVQQAREAAAKDDAAHPKRSSDKSAVAKLEGKLKSLLARDDRFGTADALAKLGIAKPTKANVPQDEDGTDAVQPGEPLEVIDCVEHPDGEPVAMIEVGRDQLLSIRLLVTATDLDDRRKAEVREVLRDAIDKLLG